jgi:hypothetical protein
LNKEGERMTIEEARLELGRLMTRQEQVEREALAILNRGCLPLEEARQKMKALGVVTEISPEGIERVVVTTPDGEKGYTGFPLWYPLYTSMDDVFESLEIDKATVKMLKKSQAEKKLMGIKNEFGDEYISDHEKVFEKIGEYRANETKIEELDGALDSIGIPGNEEIVEVKENDPSQLKEGGLAVQLSYVEDLISDGYLYPNGKTPMRNLNEAAGALVKIIKKPVTWKFLQNTFFKLNGKKYSKAACEQAQDYANMTH